MSAAEELYRTLQSFKQIDAPGNSPEKQLLDYCNQVLGNIENIHVDFKEKHDRRDSKLSDDDKKNLAKAVSGFANSGGGVLIWGIKDKTYSPKPIGEIKKFVSSLLQFSPLVTDPSTPNIEGDWIPSDEDSDQGFGLIFIPESLLPPHRVILNLDGIKNLYFIRSGNSFVVATHSQLEDMFGRRPKPILKMVADLKMSLVTTPYSRVVSIILGISNSGRGTAKSPYLSIRVYDPYNISFYGIDGNTGVGLKPIPVSGFSKESAYGATSEIVIHSGMTLEVTQISFSVDLPADPSKIKDLIIDYKLAAEGLSLIKDQKKITGLEIANFVTGNQ